MKRVSCLLGVMVALLLSSGCSPIARQEVFHACVDPQCPRCRGARTYRCEECLGRGSVPCHTCNGIGYLTCNECGGDGIKKGGHKCAACGTEGAPVGRKVCSNCDGARTEKCPTCSGRGMIECGTVTQYWVCRQCGEKFDYPASVCTKCGAK